MKTTRIEFVATPEFKASLHAQAAAAGVSVAELIRRRFTPASAEEAELSALVAELRQATVAARASLAEATAQLEAVLAELRLQQHGRDKLAA
ncbi:MAG: hypothetical protein NZ524_00310 [Thiobacillaceae bacterium]|nr:hypothetical protein [Thiobacillaceae bacterium]MCX7673959.1 hypothetical protein [Thiobacillaceae bacterium]MDW8322813.1 hypothetical protein [Burkholderiales bacterium]